MKQTYHFGLLSVLAAGLVACTAPGSTVAPTATPTPTAASPEAKATPAAKEAEKAHEEACTHMTNGPAKAVDASLTAQGRGTVAADHHRYDVKLQPQGNRFGGSVTFNNGKAGDVKFYLGFAGPASAEQKLTLVQAGKTVEFEKVDAEHVHETCPDVKIHYVAELGVGPVEIGFTGLTENTARLVIESGSEDAHGDDDHDHDHD